MSLLDTDFLQAADREMVKTVCNLVLREWGDHVQSLVDCVQYYTLVLDEIRGPDIHAPPCGGAIDLCLVSTVVDKFPRRVRDARLVWGNTDLRLEFDLYKASTADDARVFPAIEWIEYDSTVFEKRLEEERVSFQHLPGFWGEMQPCLKALVKTIYNKSEHHPAFTVTLGVEEDTATCYLLFSNLDHVSYPVLERLAEQANVVDLTVRAWERRLDIRIARGAAVPFAPRNKKRRTTTTTTTSGGGSATSSGTAAADSGADEGPATKRRRT